VLRRMDLAGAMADLKLKVSLMEAEKDPQYYEKVEAIVGEAWEAAEWSC
jgi:hypothetical protein